jgi:hypothetical protein
MSDLPHFSFVPKFSLISLWVMYLFWLIGLLLLYPFCRWFAAVKRRRRDWWLSYL